MTVGEPVPGIDAQCRMTYHGSVKQGGMTMDDTYRDFAAARTRADTRGIAWRMTFAEWWAVWEPHWPRRHLDHLCLCRNGDEGDYAVGNVHIATVRENSAEWAENRRAAIKARPEPPSKPDGPTWHEQRREAERAAFVEALHQSGGNVSAAARALGITFRAARYLMKKHGLVKSELFL